MVNIQELLRLSIVNETGAAAITAIVGERVYPSQIFSVMDPVYPCLCYELNMGVLTATVTAYQGVMRVWCWSKQHTGTVDEAMSLYNALITYWHQHAFSDATLARYVQLIQSGQPMRTTDEDARAYAVVSNWDVMGAVIL